MIEKNLQAMGCEIGEIVGGQFFEGGDHFAGRLGGFGGEGVGLEFVAHLHVRRKLRSINLQDRVGVARPEGLLRADDGLPRVAGEGTIERPFYGLSHLGIEPRHRGWRGHGRP